MTADRGVKIEKMNSDLFNFTKEEYYETGAASRWWKKLTFVIPTPVQLYEGGVLRDRGCFALVEEAHLCHPDSCAGGRNHLQRNGIGVWF